MASNPETVTLPPEPDPLVEAARIRRREFELEGETLIVVEPGALLYLDYISTRRTDEARAIANLIAACILRPDGTPRFTREQALVVATGRPEVALPIITEVTGFDAAPEKKSFPTRRFSYIAWLQRWASRTSSRSSR